MMMVMMITTTTVTVMTKATSIIIGRVEVALAPPPQLSFSPPHPLRSPLHSPTDHFIRIADTNLSASCPVNIDCRRFFSA